MPIGDQVEDRIVAVMKRFGYTGSDARTYIALSHEHPATGYELAARGGVPRSAIYGVLKRLEQAGLVNAIPGKPVRYVPIPAARLVAHLETRFARDIDDFLEGMDQIVETQSEAITWTVTGYDSVLAEATRLIGSAQESVICSLWSQEADQLLSSFNTGIERGIKTTLFSFTPLPEIDARVLSYGLSPEDLTRHWSRRIILVVDRTQLLIGATDGSRLDRAVISEEGMLVETAIANLVLDITLFGERQDTDVGPIVGDLTARHAPIEDLLSGKASRR